MPINKKNFCIFLLSVFCLSGLAFDGNVYISKGMKDTLKFSSALDIKPSHRGFMPAPFMDFYHGGYSINSVGFLDFGEFSHQDLMRVLPPATALSLPKGKAGRVYLHLQANPQNGVDNNIQLKLHGWADPQKHFVGDAQGCDYVANTGFWGYPLGLAKLYSQTGYKHLYSAEAFRVNTASQYRLKVRVRQSANGNGLGKFYAGVACLNKDHKLIGQFRYCAVAGRVLTAAENWQEFEGNIGGLGEKSCNFPKGTVYVRPLCLLNYNKGTGTTQVATMEFFELKESQLLKNPRFNQELHHWSHQFNGQSVSEILTGALMPLEGGRVYAQVGYKHLHSAEAFRVNTASQYRLKVRVRQSANGNGLGKFYAGVACLDKDHKLIGQFRYCAVAGRVLTAAENWQDFEGNIGGVGEEPCNFPSGTVYVRTACLLNYNKGTGTTQLAEISFQECKEDQLLKNPRFNQKALGWTRACEGIVGAAISLSPDIAFIQSEGGGEPDRNKRLFPLLGRPLSLLEMKGHHAGVLKRASFSIHDNGLLSPDHLSIVDHEKGRFFEHGITGISVADFISSHKKKGSKVTVASRPLRGSDLVITFHLAVDIDRVVNLTEALLALNIPQANGLNAEYHKRFDQKTPPVKLNIEHLYEAMSNSGLITPDIEKLFKHVIGHRPAFRPPLVIGGGAASPFQAVADNRAPASVVKQAAVASASNTPSSSGATKAVSQENKRPQEQSNKLYLGKDDRIFYFYSRDMKVSVKGASKGIASTKSTVPYFDVFPDGANKNIAPVIGSINFGKYTPEKLAELGIIQNYQTDMMLSGAKKCQVYLTMQALPEGWSQSDIYINPGSWLGTDRCNVQLALLGDYHSGESYHGVKLTHDVSGLNEPHKITASVPYCSKDIKTYFKVIGYDRKKPMFSKNKAGMFEAISVVKADSAHDGCDAIVTIHRMYDESRLKSSEKNTCITEQCLPFQVYSKAYDDSGISVGSLGLELRARGERDSEKYSKLAQGELSIESPELGAMLLRADLLTKPDGTQDNALLNIFGFHQ